MNTKFFPLLKSRKFWMLLPIVALPLISIFFWLTLEAKDHSTLSSKVDTLLTSLPEVNLSQHKDFDKLSYYQNAKENTSNIPGSAEPSLMEGNEQLINSYPVSHSKVNVENQEAQIYQKLQQLHQLVQSPNPSPPNLSDTTSPPDNTPNTTGLEQLLKTYDDGNAEKDPQMQQLDGLLQKILAIQHPDQFADAIAPPHPKDLYQAISAVIAGKQKVREGGVVQLKLADSAYINHHWIPKDQLIYGTCQVINHRMQIKIQTILLGRSILPVDLVIFDQHDGMIGIPLPDGQLNEAWRSGSDQAIQSLTMLPYDASTEVQIAGAGISAAKNLFSKKVKRIQFKLPDGYPILIRDNQKLSHLPSNY